MGNGHEESSDVARKVGKWPLADVGGWPTTCWADEAALTNQVSEDPSGKSNVRCCRTDPQWFC